MVVSKRRNPRAGNGLLWPHALDELADQRSQRPYHSDTNNYSAKLKSSQNTKVIEFGVYLRREGVVNLGVSKADNSPFLSLQVRQLELEDSLLHQFIAELKTKC
jgi:hypothetical protein